MSDDDGSARLRRIGAEGSSIPPERAAPVGAGDSVTGDVGDAGSEPKALDPGGADDPDTEAAKAPQGPQPTGPAARKRRAVRPTTKESPIAFRPRPGTRARLEKLAGDRPLSVVIEAAIDAYLGRKSTDVAPEMRAALAATSAALVADLAPITNLLGEIKAQEVGIGRNLNQQTRFINSYDSLPDTHSADLAAMSARHDEVLAALRAVQETVESHASIQSLARASLDASKSR